MQPHSMAAIMLAHYYWNYSNPKGKANGDISISYTDRRERSVTKYYKFYNVNESPDRRELKGTFQTPEGACEVTVRRRSPEEGADAELIHSVHHASNLRERFKLYKDNITGYHENSLKYKGINASMRNETEIEFRNDVRLIFDNDKFKTVSYTVRMVGG